jgi:hypothetical protein
MIVHRHPAFSTILCDRQPCLLILKIDNFCIADHTPRIIASSPSGMQAWSRVLIANG